MLLLRMIVILIACWIVKCDLLDLYVQHMDETMRTKLYSNKRHPIHPVSRRIKRSIEDEELLFWSANFTKTRFNVNEEWFKQWIAKRRFLNPYILYQNDALNYTNKQEKNLDPDQHEMLSNTTQDSKHPEKTTTISEDAVESSQTPIDIETAKSTPSIVKDEIESNASYYATTEEQKEASRDDELSIVRENQTDVGKFVVEPLEFAGEISAENWKDSEEMENKESLEYEIISENERINPKPFDDPSPFRKMPKLRENRIPKKYFPPVEKSVKSHIKDTKVTRRFARSAKEGGNNREIFNAKVPKFTRYEKLDEDGDVILEWDPSDDEEVTFKVTAKTLGYVGIGFNEKSHMMGADILLTWVDDHTGVVSLLVSFLLDFIYSDVTMIRLIDRKATRGIDKSQCQRKDRTILAVQKGIGAA